MKTLLLVRHAKSSWDDPAVSDFDRPLNERGKADAPIMAKRIKDKEILIDAFVSSSAKRARKTAKIFAHVFATKDDEIILAPELYLAQSATFISVISKLPPNFNTVAVFSHNPGITDFANSLTTTKLDDMPTCSIFAVNIFSDDWAGFETAAKQFLFFDYPKAEH